MPIPTSERVSEAYSADCHSSLIQFLHRHTYELALSSIEPGHVLDLGCGTGYGSAILAQAADSVVGVDVSEDAIREARAHHTSANLSFQTVGDIERQPLPFEDGSFDAITSFHVIEHLSDTGLYLREAKRVLKPGGRFIAVTPNRVGRLFAWQRPWNRFHVREYDSARFEETLRSVFSQVEIKGCSADEDLLLPEIKRTRRLRILMLPLTLPFIPDPARRAGLGLLSWIRFQLFWSRAKDATGANDPSCGSEKNVQLIDDCSGRSPYLFAICQ